MASTEWKGKDGDRGTRSDWKNGSLLPKTGTKPRGVRTKRNQPYLPVELVMCELFHTDPIHF